MADEPYPLDFIITALVIEVLAPKYENLTDEEVEEEIWRLEQEMEFRTIGLSNRTNSAKPSSSAGAKC